ncbi:hypothetical protein FPQ18DRAFT_354171 [Pyronema domesticum]|uniref:Similar to SET domain-containing protein 5 acc. no. O74467 n=1 Tax=Pyronema omphalodes (strain CBS 100304) TaxID=1076935 RepID=U4KXM6_PYROM|nr:hypothetical protein FPQ18DRAFT_354171 [Pyronema domesticum]CCX06260.1 Similar to SET domain-containing protein 5; acc. no. O74467 [Pyronema omphalodes CBS 100304]
MDDRESNSAPILYQQAAIPGKGIGMLATSPIASGSLIIAETPLFIVPSNIRDCAVMATPALKSYVLTAVSRLTKPQQSAFLSLHNAQVRSTSELPPFLSIISTNAFGLGIDATKSGVFETCSRFNHSCVPNANFVWNEGGQKLEVRAVEDIQEGEEILLSYLGSKLAMADRLERQQSLRLRYGFQCQCAACGLDAPEAAADNLLRAEAKRLDELIGDGVLIATNPARALKYCRDLMNVRKRLKQTPEIPRVYYDAFQVCVAHGDLARAKVFMRLHNDMKERIEGDWAVDAEKRELVERPERHRLYRQVSRRWNTNVQHAREEGSEGFVEWLWMRAG